MNRKGVLVSVVLMALLAVAAWWAMRPGRVANGAGPALVLPGWDAGVVRVVRIGWPDGSSAVLRAGVTPESWMLETSGPAGAGAGERWPVNAATVRAALRLISEAMGEAQSAAQPEFAAGGPVVELEAIDGRRAQLEIAGQTLAGRVAMRVADDAGAGARAYLMADSLARLFEREAVRAWRSTRLLPVEVSPSRIAISTRGGPCELTKVANRWGLVDPPLGRADAEAVARLIADLSGLEVARLGGGESEGGFGPDSPRLMVGADQRVVAGDDVRRRTIQQDLTIGGPADVAGRTVFVRLSGRSVGGDGQEESAWGPVVGVADAAKLAAVPTAALDFVDRRAVAMPVADVREVRFFAVSDDEPGAFPGAAATTARREASGWTWRAGGEPAAAMSDGEAKMLQSLLQLLSDQRAEEVTTRPGGEELARLELRGVEGAGGVQLTLGMEPAAGGGTRLFVRDERVQRWYSAQASAGLANWIRACVSPAR